MTTENMPKKSNTGYYIAAAVIVIVIIVVGIVAYEATLSSPNPTPSPTGSTTPSPSSSGSTISVTIYAGEVSASQYGFGNSASSITSPGPQLTFKVGDTVKVTLVNSSPTVPHNWAIVNAQSSTAPVQFNAQIQSASNPVAPGGSASVTFTVTQAGSFYYICQVPGHVALGMYGTVTVNP
jgi:nitrite reductase (NO-forming)